MTKREKQKAVRTTCTNGNATNGIRGSRVRYWDAEGKLIGQQIVPARYGVKYCQKWENGRYGQYHKKMFGW